MDDYFMFVEKEQEIKLTHRAGEWYGTVSYRPTGVQDTAAVSSLIAGSWALHRASTRRRIHRQKTARATCPPAAAVRG